MTNIYSSRRNSRRGKPTFARRKTGKRKSKLENVDPRRFVKPAKPIEQTAYQPTNAFTDFGFHSILKLNLALKGYTHPTLIQDKAIEPIMQQRDVVGIASTGTGKTAAFLLPIQHKLISNPGYKVLIIAPTRELALQIQKESRDFSEGANLYDTLLIGGTNISRQIAKLKRKPDIIIGTPGRIKDHLERGTLKLSDVSTVVLDEVDRMLDMGFINDIRHILSCLPQDRQSLFFSATINDTIEQLITTFSKDAKTIKTKTSDTSDNVEQTIVYYQENADRFDKLHGLLQHETARKSIVFAETKRSVDKLTRALVERGLAADCMHGNKSQGQRQRALKKFRSDEVAILVATDVASRGIDVEGVTHVINYDLPQTYDDYVHRIGRAGRGNSIGYAMTFVK